MQIKVKIKISVGSYFFQRFLLDPNPALLLIRTRLILICNTATNFFNIIYSVNFTLVPNIDVFNTVTVVVVQCSKSTGILYSCVVYSWLGFFIRRHVFFFIRIIIFVVVFYRIELLLNFRGEEAELADNVFYPLCYEGTVQGQYLMLSYTAYWNLKNSLFF